MGPQTSENEIALGKSNFTMGITEEDPHLESIAPQEAKENNDTTLSKLKKIKKWKRLMDAERNAVHL